jgi:hypothetical protein
MSLSAPEPSKRAKSQRALDLIHGRRGGRSLPRQSDYDQALAVTVAETQGDIVRATCGCTRWLVARRDVGTRCRACDQPMLARLVILDDPPSIEQRDEAGWIHLGQAIGACVVCDQPCRSWDPDDRPRHPTCCAA